MCLRVSASIATFKTSIIVKGEFSQPSDFMALDTLSNVDLERILV